MNVKMSQHGCSSNFLNFFNAQWWIAPNLWENMSLKQILYAIKHQIRNMKNGSISGNCLMHSCKGLFSTKAFLLLTACGTHNSYATKLWQKYSYL